MRKSLYKKGLVFGVITLFIGAGVISNIGGMGTNNKVLSDNFVPSSRFEINELYDKDISCLCDGLVGYWNFNEGIGSTAHDKSGCGNDGKIHGATWSTGVIDKALSFDGMDDYVSIQNNDSLDIRDSITIGAWLNLRDNDSGYVVLKQYSYGFPKLMGSNKIEFYLNIDGGCLLRYSSTVPDNEWHYFVATYNGSIMKIYLDGNEVNSTTQTGSIETTFNDLYLGYSSGWHTPQYYNGTIDEVRIYNRSLSEEEIKYLYYLPSLKRAFLFGFINNLTCYGPYSTFKTKSLVYISLFPVDFKVATSNKEFVISNCCYLGYAGPRFIIGRFKAAEV